MKSNLMTEAEAHIVDLLNEAHDAYSKLEHHSDLDLPMFTQSIVHAQTLVMSRPVEREYLAATPEDENAE